MNRTGSTTDRLLPQLESSVLGRHVLAADDATTMRGLLGVAQPVLPDDPTVDIGPIVQRAYDDGAEVLQLVSGSTYLWNTPVFLDRDSMVGGFVIEGNRSRILLGSGLPTTDWTRDPATRFAIFPNTKRSALQGGRVAATAANRATGTAGAIRPLTLRNVTLDGKQNNRGFSYGNRCAVTFDQVVLWGARVGLTWADYSDGNALINCYSKSPGYPGGQVLVEQTAQGDGLLISGGKADISVALARLKYCRGATISSVVTGRLVFDECSAIAVVGGHFEGQDADLPMLGVVNSQVVLQGCVLYETYDSSIPCIQLDDGGSDLSSSDLTLQDCIVMQLITPDQKATSYSPYIGVGTVRAGTRITVRGLQGKHASSGDPGQWRDTAQPFISGGPAALQTALGSSAGRAAQANGDFLLRQTSSGWDVSPSDGGPMVSRRQSSAPSIQRLGSDTKMRRAGALTTGRSYAYVVAVKDALGNFSPLSPSVSASVGASAMLSLDVFLADAPGTLVVWRANGESATAGADRYVVLPARSAHVHLYDTGSQIGGRPWITTGVPSPSVAGTSNDTRDALLLGGKAVS